MDRKNVERLRVKLSEKRTDLLDRVRSARTSEHDPEEDEAPDLGDRALSTVSRDLKYQLTGSERDLVKRIDDALGRIAAGTYGACVHCSAKIHAARLEAVPWARHCIDCQELQDRGEI